MIAQNESDGIDWMEYKRQVNECCRGVRDWLPTEKRQQRNEGEGSWLLAEKRARKERM